MLQNRLHATTQQQVGIYFNESSLNDKRRLREMENTYESDLVGKMLAATVRKSSKE